MTVLIDGKLEDPLIKDKKVSLLGRVICGQKISMGSVSEGSSCVEEARTDPMLISWPQITLPSKDYPLELVLIRTTFLSFISGSSSLPSMSTVISRH
ncbi:hypothetical protein PPACK8108_LOCUS17718 [Phakopsora pachyrhizi]|uniref:Uncharacterized protein n=1 Tax=Phakopsora pachyrhizi TaxID=170000 RepID=A0AAV0B9U6_PHAPC|nr:hypothetical protein PPACK8108_LOCUS17718 [Phakopsora pachyrhizi]